MWQTSLDLKPRSDQLGVVPPPPSLNTDQGAAKSFTQKHSLTGDHRYQVGEVFVHASSDDTNEMLEKAKKKIDADIAELEEKRAAHVETLKDLKVQLYAKFGTNINLEADD